MLPIATNQWLIKDKLGGVHLTSVNSAAAMKDPVPMVYQCNVLIISVY